MAKKRQLLIVGNWKTNPGTLKEAKKLFLNIQKGLPQNSGVMIAPPSPFISDLYQIAFGHKIKLAAQDVSSEVGGAFTGEVSLPMLKSAGAAAVIVGHSERRARGEKDEDVNKKVTAVIKYRATAIVCVGEKSRDGHGNFFGVVEAQLKAALKGIKAADLKHIVVAYEPVWAIGTGNNATPEDAHEMKLFIRKVLADNFTRQSADKVPILYGGSVTPQNTADLTERGGVDGFLVGKASLKAREFLSIVNEATGA